MHRKYKIPGTHSIIRGILVRLASVWVVFLEHGGGALGIFKSPVCTYNQAWTFSLSASHYFSFLSKPSGRRMPPAERSALYYILVLNCTRYGSHQGMPVAVTERCRVAWLVRYTKYIGKDLAMQKQLCDILVPRRPEK